LNKKVVFSLVTILIVFIGFFIIWNSLHGYKPEYKGLKSFKILSITDSTLDAEVKVGIMNTLPVDIKLEKLKADILDTKTKIGEIAVDSLVVLPSDSVIELKFRLGLDLKKTMKLLSKLNDTLHLIVTGDAVAGFSFFSFPVSINVPVPVKMGSSLFTSTTPTNSSIGDSIIKIKSVSNFALSGDSLNFSLTFELNNPYNIELVIESIDSGTVMIEGREAGKICLEESITVSRQEKEVKGVIKASSFVGDIITSGPSALFGLITSGGNVNYEVKGKLIIVIFDEKTTIPITYKGVINIKEVLKP
jgi:LEA14-like dessication related protein